MDGNRFDALARSLHSRRGVARTLAAIASGMGLARRAGAAPKAAGSRFGCTKHDNTCGAKSGGAVPCPDAPGSNTVCVKNNKGKPVCASAISCFRCKRKADCVAKLGSTARCVKKCPFCQNEGVAKSACIVPLT